MSVSELFLWPAAWPLLLLVPIAWPVLRGLDRKRMVRLRVLVGARAGVLGSGMAARQRTRRRLLQVGGLLLALLAVLQPSFGTRSDRLTRQGIDLILCLDVSRSMLAADLAPTRLKAAQGSIRRLAELGRGDRLGLISFAGSARLTIPLTRDMTSYVELMEQAGPLDVRRGGSDLGAALEAALAALGERTDRHAAVVLISDGEDLEGRGLSVAEACAARGITVHCIGVGTVLGSKIALGTGMGGRFLQDRNGDEVVSSLDDAGLRRIASATGGLYIDATSGNGSLIRLYREGVLPLAHRELEAERRRERRNRFQWPLLLAFLIWLSELGWVERSRR